MNSHEDMFLLLFEFSRPLYLGCPVAMKRVRGNKRMTLATAALVAMESDIAPRPSVSSAHPIHLLSLSPIKIPLLTSPNPGKDRLIHLSKTG